MGKKVHFLGIGGSGASAAAAIAQAQGYEVTGCDLEPHNEFTTHFKNSQLSKGHNPDHLYCHPERSEGYKLYSSPSVQNDKFVDILAVTPAIFSLDPNNPELLAAKEKGIPVLTWQQFVGEHLAKNKFVIAICGTHGKTTTTAMIAQILEDAKLDPTVLLGAIHPKWKANYRVPSHRHPERSEGSHDYFIIEADEFNDNFLHLKPDITVVTNIEMDHPEYFKDFEAYKESFRKFLQSTKQTIIVNLSDPEVSDVIASVAKQSKREIATSPSAPRNDKMIDYSKHLIDFPLQIPGDFNAMNASAAYQMGLVLGIKPQTIQKSLATYPGIGRRFEYIGKFHGAEVYSDFGHHPTEIKVTMEAAREKFPNQRILLVYQPHMFSRTKTLFYDFVKVFKNLPIDQIIITDIYPSREVDTGTVSSQQLVETIHSNTSMYHSKKDLKAFLKNEVKKDDILFFMGAGDIDKMAREFTQTN